MSTFMPKADEIERKWYVIDAADKPLGRVAAEAATLLRGKHKPIFAPMWIAAILSSSSTPIRPFSPATS